MVRILSTLHELLQLMQKEKLLIFHMWKIEHLFALVCIGYLECISKQPTISRTRWIY